MNRRSPGFSLSKALVGFLNAKAAEGISPRTLSRYEIRPPSFFTRVAQ